MNGENRYIKLAVNFESLPFWKSPHAVQLWLYCMGRAAFKTHQWQGIVVKRGQFPTSLNSIEKDTGLSRKTILKHIKTLEDCGEISSTVCKHGTMITMLKYDAKRWNKSTTDGWNNSTDIGGNVTPEGGGTIPPTVIKGITEERTVYTDGFSSFYGKYPKRVGREEAEEAYINARKAGNSHAAIMKALDEWLPTLSDAKYAPKPAKWFEDQIFTEEDKSAW